MRRGDLYRVCKANTNDPKKFRVFVIVSRQVVIDSRFSTVVCAPIYSRFDGLATQVPVSQDEGLKGESAIHCDELVSIPKFKLTHFVSTLSSSKLDETNQALRIALAIEETQ